MKISKNNLNSQIGTLKLNKTYNVIFKIFFENVFIIMLFSTCTTVFIFPDLKKCLYSTEDV